MRPLEVADNPWYTSVPTVLPQTKEDNDKLSKLTELNESYSGAKGDDQKNLLVDYIVNVTSSPEEAAAYVKDTMNGDQYLKVKQIAWEELLDYFTSLQ